MEKENFNTWAFFGAILIVLMVSGCIGGGDGGQPSGDEQQPAPSSGDEKPSNGQTPPETALQRLLRSFSWESLPWNVVIPTQ